MINAMMQAAERVMQVYGIRVVEEPVETIEIGSTLPESRVWIDNDPTDETLGGTSAVLVCADRDAVASDLETAISKATKAGYSGQTILLIGGRDGYTLGEDSREVIIRRAVVLGAWSR